MKYPLLILCILASLLCYGQKSSQVKELENQRKAIEKEIETTSGLLEQTKETTQRSLARLSLLSAQIKQRKQMIALLNSEINVTDREIADTRREIAGLKKEIDEKCASYGTSLRLIQKHKNAQDKLLFIFSASGFAQSLRRVHYLRQYAAWKKRQAADIISRQEEIKSKADELEQARDEKQRLLLVRENEYKKIEEDEATQKQYVATLSKQQGELRRELQSKQRSADLISRQIEQQIANEVARARDTRNLDERLGNDRSSAILRDEQLTEGFAANRGRLVPPLNKPYTIVRDYGEQGYPNLQHVKINNNGIDLQTTADAEACTVFDGEVRTIYTLSNVPGWFIIVRHGNFLTVYSNLKEVYVKLGDRIKARHPLGKIYTDNDRATILHFELWKDNERQNPRLWIGQ